VPISAPRVLVACLLASLVACTGSSTLDDAGTRDDAGPASDAGPPVDGGAHTDAGPADDAGPPVDGGAHDDAGPANDAGPPVDGGAHDDAGPANDAGPPVDGGAHTDAGPPDDAGAHDDAGLQTGCEVPTALPAPIETDLTSLDLSTTGVVRAVWFAPADRSFAPGLHERIERLLDVTEAFYRDEMALHGFVDDDGVGRSFTRARDADGRFDVVFMRGEQPSSFYHAHPNSPDAPGEALREMFLRLPSSFHQDATVLYFYDTFVVDGDTLLHTGQGGSAAPWQGANAGYALIGAHVLGVGFSTVALDPVKQACLFDDEAPSGLVDYAPEGGFGPLSRGAWSSVFVGAVVHEIGHAYGLEHDFVDHDGDGIESNVMGNGFRAFGARFTTSIAAPATVLGPWSATQLAPHPYIE
jgi:hypothetical protein